MSSKKNIWADHNKFHLKNHGSFYCMTFIILFTKQMKSNNYQVVV